MFVSTYESAIDAKGRVSVPASFRAAMGGDSRVFLYPAVDGSGCLEGGGDALMNLYRQTLARMGPNDPARKVFMHTIFTKAADLKMDEPGRIKIPDKLLAEAGITKRVLFAGSFDRFHIWDPDRFAEFDQQMTGSAPDLQKTLDEPFQRAVAAGGIIGVTSSDGGQG